MLNLLTAERIKLIRSKKLWIVLGIFLLLPIYQVAMAQLNVSYGAELIQVKDTVINGATGVLMMKKNGLTILLVMSAFICFSIGEEFQYGTIRNALSLGRSRTHYYLTKLAMAAIVSLLAVTLLTVVGIISYSFMFGFGEVEGINNYYNYAVQAFVTLFLLILANASIYVMIGFVTRNSGIALIWSFLYTIATGFLPDLFRQTEHFKQLQFWFTETFLFYFNFASPQDIARFPEMMLVSVITILLTTTLGIILFKRTDIK